MQRGQDGMQCGGGGKVFVARGKAGLTAQRQRCLVPPGFLLKTRPPFPPRISLLCLLSFLHHHSLIPLPLSSFCPFPPSPSSSSRSLSFSHSISLTCLVFFPPSSSGPLQTLSSGLRGGGIWLGRLRGDKSPEMQRSDESGWL